jgi:uncharacterized surface protein with fasciclin (FAS1) repeats
LICLNNNIYVCIEQLNKIIMKNLFKKITLLAVCITVFSCSDDDTTPQQTITDIAVSNPDFSILVQALTRAELAGVLDGSGQYTVFAPTNDAFNTFFALLGPNVDVTNVDLPTLKSILLNHVIEGEIKSANIPASSYQRTLSPFSSANGAPTISMFIQKAGSTVTINGGPGVEGNLRKGAIVAAADIDASNGVIHVVNRVIQIPNIVDHAISNPNFTSLVAALTRAGNTTNFAGLLSGTTDSPFTVFAPTNAAFTAALAELSFANLAAIPEPTLDKILKYHVIAGANVREAALPSTPVDQITFLGQTFKIGTSGGAKITDFNLRVSNIIATDVQCSNGVIHVLDKVLVPNLN